MKKILLIDGHSILTRAFYGVPLLTTGDGLHTNAVYGFINIMLKVIDDEKPDALAVAFDLREPTFRHKRYSEYKGTRKPMPEELHEQVPVIQDLLKAMEIPILTLPGYEADDILGTIAKKYQGRGYEVTVVSGDRDLLQLSDEHIKIVIPKTSKGVTTVSEYYPEDVLREYKVTPAGIIELKALMGDSSDNIPGLPGVGEKTASAIIAEYQTIENARLHADEIKPPRASKALKESYESAELSKWLATINTDSPIDVAEDDCTIGVLYTPAAYAMARKLNFKSILKRFPESDMQEAGVTPFDENENIVIKDGSITYVSELKPLLKDGSITSRTDVYDISIARYLLNPLTKPSPAFDREDAEKVFAELKDQEMWNLYTDIEMPLVYSLADMEAAGVKVDADRLHAYGEELKQSIDSLEQDIHENAGSDFNINSPKQLGEILFEKMQMPGGKKTKTGYSTSADVLEKLAPEYPFVRKILEFRQLSKLHSTYAAGLSDYIAADGRIHGSFNQTVTATGRISSSDPNLQNIPIRTEMGSRFREVFVPDEGYSFVDADYSQIELRVLAAMSCDEELISAYKNAVDVHTVTASKVFHVAPEDVTPLQRRNAKAVNFGVVYGISAFGLSEGLSISRKEAQEYINNYFKTYPKVKEYLDGQIAFAKEHGYVKTLYGRRRPIPELKASNFMQRQFGERIAMNSPIQGTAADIMKIAMINVDKALKDAGLDARIVLQIHDELLVEVRDDQAEACRNLVAETMRNAADIGVSLEVDAHIGKSWLEAK